MAARVEHPLCARLYVRQTEQAERLGLADRRAQLLAGLSDRVLEIGARQRADLRALPDGGDRGDRG
jgi:hypothetical protein